ncbi:MAG: hypothetical protein AAF821_05235 [Cyanobacteria bacterium P01_D01_bin.156]
MVISSLVMDATPGGKPAANRGLSTEGTGWLLGVGFRVAIP